MSKSIFMIVLYITIGAFASAPRIQNQTVSEYKFMLDSNVNKGADGSKSSEPGQDHPTIPNSISFHSKSGTQITSSSNPSGEPKPVKNWWDDSEFWIAIFTMLLAVVTGTLAYFTYKLYAATVELGRDSRQTSDRQAKEMMDSINLARDEFAASHRPQIIVHSFESSLNDEQQIAPAFISVNAGTSAAKIIEIGYKIFFSDMLRPGIQMQTKQFDSVVLNSGETKLWFTESYITENQATIEGMKPLRGLPALQLMCIGYIKYADMRGGIRQTGFCRQYDAATNIWRREDSSDYEYAY